MYPCNGNVVVNGYGEDRVASHPYARASQSVRLGYQPVKAKIAESDVKLNDFGHPSWCGLSDTGVLKKTAGGVVRPVLQA